MNFVLQGIEILKKRDKTAEPCLPDGVNYDEIILNDHLGKVGCRAPYQKTIENWKICESREKFRAASYDAMRFKFSKMACTSAATITFIYEEKDYDLMGSDLFHVYTLFPNQYKEIVMVRAVDIQTAIGNAGGYIGLLLGNVTINFLRSFGCSFKIPAYIVK